MTTDPRTTDMEYRLARLEETVHALTGMVESLVAIRHVGAPLGEVVHDEAAELVPSTAETAALTAADLDALPGGTTVYDADGDVWVKTGTRWRLDNGVLLSERASILIKVYGPITATN